MKKWILRAILLGIIVALSLSIFSFSAQNATESGGLSTKICEIILRIFCGRDSVTPERVDRIEPFIRKLAHFSEYLVLGFSWLWLIRTFEVRHAVGFWAAVGVSALYAVSDEVHQLFVPGRSGQVTDVLLDTAGALCGALLWTALAALFRKKTKN